MAHYRSQRAIDQLVGNSATRTPVEATIGARFSAFSGGLKKMLSGPLSEYDILTTQILDAGVRIASMESAREVGQVFSTDLRDATIGRSPFMRYGRKQMLWCWWLQGKRTRRGRETELILLGSPDNDPSLQGGELPQAGFGFPSYPNSLSRLIQAEFSFSDSDAENAISDSSDLDFHNDPGYRLEVARQILKRGMEIKPSDGEYKPSWPDYRVGRVRVIAIADSIQPAEQAHRGVLARPVLVCSA